VPPGKRSLLNVDHVNARERGKSKRGKPSIPEAKSCVIVGKRNASPITMKVEKRED